MTDIWKDISGFDNYQVSNFGKIRNKKTNRTLKINTEHCGYNYVLLYKNGKAKLSLIHRLVAEAFVPNPNNLPCVNHKDECKTNNVYTNLEWVTHKMNNNYGTRNKRISEKRCKKICQYTANGVFIREWDSIDSAANYYNILRQGISQCCRKCKYTKTYKGFKWEYKQKRTAFR